MRSAASTIGSAPRWNRVSAPAPSRFANAPHTFSGSILAIPPPYYFRLSPRPGELPHARCNRGRGARRRPTRPGPLERRGSSPRSELAPSLAGPRVCKSGQANRVHPQRSRLLACFRFTRQAGNDAFPHDRSQERIRLPRHLSAEAFLDQHFIDGGR
jgi:hypothetical protein